MPIFYGFKGTKSIEIPRNQISFHFKGTRYSTYGNYHHRTLASRERGLSNTWLLFYSSRNNEGVVAQSRYPLALLPEQSGGMGSIPGKAPPLEHHDKGSRTPLGLFYFCDPSAWH